MNCWIFDYVIQFDSTNPGNIASSGKNRDLETLFSGSGLNSGNVNPGQPSRGKLAMDKTISLAGSKSCASFLLDFMLASTMFKCTGKAP